MATTRNPGLLLATVNYAHKGTVPRGKNLFVPIANSEDSPPPHGTINDFLTAVPGVIDGIASLEVDLAQARKGKKYLIGGAGEWPIPLHIVITDSLLIHYPFVPTAAYAI
jgi:hypothetical protein